jgi:hypothetical protein
MVHATAKSLICKTQRKLLQVNIVEIAHEPIFHSAANRLDQVIPLLRHPAQPSIFLCHRPDENVDDVLMAAEDYGCHGMSIKIIQAAADQSPAARFVAQ